jgi:hypothetical protein
VHFETDCPNSLVNQSSVLAGSKMAHIIDAAWEDEIVQGSSATVEPGQQSLTCLGHKFELDGPLGFLLHDRRPIVSVACT